MKFQLPQFIETEVKLVGPFTLKQFLWLGAGAALVGILVNVIKGIALFLIVPPIAIFFIALAFLKIQGMPMINYIAYALSYSLNPKKYLFTSEERDPTNFKQP
jgi:hypothetical protein